MVTPRSPLAGVTTACARTPRPARPKVESPVVSRGQIIARVTLASRESEDETDPRDGAS